MVYVKRYITLLAPKSCSNPFLEHAANRRGTSVITMALTDLHPCLKLVPGNRLCQECNRRCYGTLSTAWASEFPARETGASESDAKAASQDVNEGLVAIDESSVTSCGQNDRKSSAKRKLRHLQEREDPEHADFRLAQPSSSSAQINPEFNVADYVSLMQDLKEKYDCEHERAKKFQILTLSPSSWSRQKIMNFLGASERHVRDAIKLRSETGVLSVPPRKRGRPLSEDIKEAVRKFYEDDAVSYCLPGKKDVIRGHQKRLLLMNLRELHEEWKRNSPFKCGFSSFASLRPAHCVLAGGCGTRTVCVCLEHQNIKLMLHAAGINAKTEEILTKTVCNLDNEACMLNKCAQCPGTSCVELEIRNAPTLNTQHVDNIHVQQWVSGARCKLETIILPPEDFCDRLLSMLSTLKTHHYVSKRQAQYLRDLKKKTSTKTKPLC